MIELSVTMRHERAVRPLPANALRRKLCWQCRQWASCLVEGELRLATTPDEDPETDRSDVRLHMKTLGSQLRTDLFRGRLS